MANVLQIIHTQCGDKPKVGRIFRVRDSNSVAVFFNVVKRTQGNTPVAGMLIATRVAPDDVEAALVTDDASRFSTSFNPMMQTLLGRWHPAGARAGSAPRSAPAESLRPFSLQDRSASAAFPDGWKVSPSSGGGTILAEGPNGEQAALGFPFLAMDSSNPRVQQTMRFAQSPAGRNTVYAHSLYYPYGGDPGRMFVDLLQMTRRMHGQQPVNIQITGETPLPAGGVRCVHLTGNIDAHDNRGMKELNTVYCVGREEPMGSYMTMAIHTAVPLTVADKERATMAKVLQSFSMNMSVISAQASALAAPAIEQIHAIGRAAEARIAAVHAEEDAHNQSVEDRWDSQDKRNQAFSNYLLDQSVIKNVEGTGHATVSNAAAESLVHNAPDRYEYVPTADFWKGVDY
jgi:hypothetical protein